MNNHQLEKTLKQELQDIVENNILNYWMTKMVDEENGGFYGRRDGNDQLIPDAPKSAILNGRILWAFSAAYRVLGKPEYLDMAQRAKDYILQHFIDKEYSGVYWTVDYQGNPLDTKKHVYAMAVILFALAEYVYATDDEEVLQQAKSLFYNMEGRTADAINSGYTEAMSRYWLPIKDQRLSNQDESTEHSLNTHLHLLEAYTCLYRVWPHKVLESRLRRLLGLLLEKMVNPETNHIGLFFSETWQKGKETRSYGHSIEAAWMVLDAAKTLGDPILFRYVFQKIQLIAAAADEGLRPNGGMIYMSVSEEDGFRHVEDYHWWVQAESILGHWYLYRFMDDSTAFSVMLENFRFLKDHLIDRKNGEWFWSCDGNGTVNHRDDKAGMWKDPCHNTRMCIKLLEDLAHERDF